MYLLDEVGVEGDVFYGGGEVAAGGVHQAWEEGFLKLKSKQKYFAYRNFFCNVDKFQLNLTVQKLCLIKGDLAYNFFFNLLVKISVLKKELR